MKSMNVVALSGFVVSQPYLERNAGLEPEAIFNLLLREPTADADNGYRRERTDVVCVKAPGGELAELVMTHLRDGAGVQLQGRLRGNLNANGQIQSYLEIEDLAFLPTPGPKRKVKPAEPASSAGPTPSRQMCFEEGKPATNGPPVWWDEIPPE